MLATEARIAEYDYSSRFETSVHEAPEIVLPDGEIFSAGSVYWEKHHSRTDSRQHMRSLLVEYADADEEEVEAILGQYPLNRRSHFEVRESGRVPFTGKRKLTGELRICAHLERFVRYRDDDQPATQSDLLTVVNDGVARAEREETHHLVAIASPMRWTNAVESAVARGQGIGAEFSRQVDVVLVDLQELTLVYDDSAPLVSGYARLFEFTTPNEEISDCVSVLCGQYVEDGSVRYATVEAAAEETRFDEYTIAAAFARLDEEGDGTRRQTPHGLVLDFRE